MSLNLGTVKSAPVAATTEQPNADRWLNFGYPVEKQTENGKIETTFISLPYGTALDTMKPKKGTGQIAAASNALLAYVDNTVAQFEPGTEKLFKLVSVDTGEETGLYVQLRRVKSEQSIASNPLVKSFKLVA